MTIDELLAKYRAEELSTHELGTKFERLMKNFIRTYPAYRGKFSDVWLWSEFPYRNAFGGNDLGIDLVAKTFGGEFWAVQCKFYAETAPIDKPAVDTFLATSSKTFGGKNFSVRLWIATSDNLTDNAEKTFQNQTPPVVKITLEDLRNAEVDWEKLDAGKFGEEAAPKKILRDYQAVAVETSQKYFVNNDRGKLIMACGTGKTFTALKIAENLAPNGKILFLVPSITLIKQTLVEWARNSEKPFNAVCVCSDKTAADKNNDEIRDVNLPLPPTTDPKEIFDAINRSCSENFGMTVIFSTYQSLEKVSETKIEFDLIICDEAHRTTGSSKDSATQFTFVHDDNNIRAKKRLYMTATPRMYNSDAKTKAADCDITLWSMDDPKIYGKTFYRLDFGTAVDKNLLADYKVIVLTVNEKVSADKKPDDDTAKIDGCINALSKKMIDISAELAEIDPSPMHTAVSFCPNIKASKIVAEIFNSLAESKKNLLKVHATHVDGTQSSKIREKSLHNLKSTPADGNICNILTNVRCLSEGVDVPALDAVIFMSSKKSRVKIVQAVGRVMRKAQNKKYGYIIIPVVVPLDKNPEEILEKSAKYGVIWEVLNALRAHDKRIDIFIEEIRLNKKSDKILITKPEIGGDDDEKPFQTVLDFGAWKDFLYARMVERVGNRRYWEQWANDIAEIADRHIRRINELISVDGDQKRAFGNFVHDLQQNLNPAVTNRQAIEMLAQHIVSRPVFEAIFENYSFVRNNPVSQTLEKVLNALDIRDSDEESARLKNFFDSVRRRCAIAVTAEQKQAIIVDLYEKFFKVATPKTVDRLGIVYTPVEVVDFILRSVDSVLKKYFNRSISDKNVHILDPFAGTGTFITRLIQSGLIRQEDLRRKYQNELHANEIVLLAYYIAAINVENAFHDRVTGDGTREKSFKHHTSPFSFVPYSLICFTDTFELYERGEIPLNLAGVMKINSARVNAQQNAPIEVIIGNPPYSVGQNSANDNNQNQYYPKLEARIAATYAKGAKSTNKGKIYDSYVKAFRWASDRISSGGVIGFVTNAGWLDGAAMDGLRKCFANEFSAIFVFNLRGNQRTQGEISRREGGKIFGSGSRAPIAITILVKTPDFHGDAQIFYRDIGDYLSRDEKLARIRDSHDVLSDEFQIITPNKRGDWINQRGNDFDTFIPLFPTKKFDGAAKSFFVTYSKGINTARDAWNYNFSRSKLEKNMFTTIDFYNSHETTDFDPKKFIWNRSAVQNKNRGVKIEFDGSKIVDAAHRPFCGQNLYFDEHLNEMIYQIPKLFPTGREENLLICVSGVASNKNFSVMITDRIPSLDFLEKVQCFGLYWYERAAQGSLFGENSTRRDGISDFILNLARKLYGGQVTREDIFYYVYGFLHLPGYRAKFANELKKSLPRIILVADAQKFWALSDAGRSLASIHLNYETQPFPDGVELQLGMRNEELGIVTVPAFQIPNSKFLIEFGGDFRVQKLKLSPDKTILHYNDRLTIKNIPARSFDYVVNGRSPLEWIIDRYRVKTDKTSGILNDPNDWAVEHGNPRYILDLILSSITVSLKTLDIVENLPEIDFDA